MKTPPIRADENRGSLIATWFVAFVVIGVVLLPTACHQWVGVSPVDRLLPSSPTQSDASGQPPRGSTADAALVADRVRRLWSIAGAAAAGSLRR